jgi:Cu+-exporting ATPase
MVVSVENKSTHPIGEVFTDYLEEDKIELLDVQNFENIPGQGVIGKINNEEIILGNSKILEKYNIPNIHLEDEKKLAKMGNSIIYVAKNQEILAIIGVNDVIREEAKEAIEKLSKMKIDTIMLTGDNKENAEKISSEIGITNVISNVLPSEKANIIKKLKEENKFVAMCGDGINDSPALAISDIGISISNATDIAIDSSEVILTKNNLNSIIYLIDISKKTIRNIKQNLFWAFFYNCLMIPIAMGLFKWVGISINPMFASLAMVLSSITVVLNTLRLKK